MWIQARGPHRGNRNGVGDFTLWPAPQAAFELYTLFIVVK